ncbi:Crp/Fnr family transcriptional regulator [Dysgonomonas sp. GY617]|uniref:Crp/Fnr family transcriptional regulator n=1 Tax=Dysgonomonas sp. GY617 TaxID=2780420 RepID=UPI0018848722|nr:Crp/Fnr family transcriptional regulator [Dysgonomonas sp. GY617]MBF0574679.1 Crp/Fnr family transcriptional regulator [Dysgonomonas sp. GY617]
MKKHFASLNILSPEELDRIDPFLSQRKIKKGEFLIQSGNICKEIAFIRSGVLRSYFIDGEGEELINCITFEGELMSAFSSFITQVPTNENIQAILDTEIEVLQKTDLDYLYQTSAEWQEFGRILTEMQYLKLEERIISFQNDDATKRYMLLEKNNSEYVKHIPLHYIASYLGISTRHLTRIRKSLL